MLNAKVHGYSWYETLFLQREIVQQEQYYHPNTMHNLPQDSTVIDIGCNIGLFSLWCNTRFLSHRAKFHLIDANGKVLECAKKNQPDNTNWTFDQLLMGEMDNAEKRFISFDLLTGWSSSHVAFSQNDKIDHLFQYFINTAYIMNLIQIVIYPFFYVIVKLMLLLHEEKKIKTVTLSTWMKTHGIDRVDLLKIDVEGSELDILRGIKSNDWQKIDRIVLEVEQNHEIIIALLEQHGYSIHELKHEDMKKTPYTIVHAFKNVDNSISL